jgi:hypothetical protein
VTKLTWGLPGVKTFESGIDHGVLYFAETGVVWKGLISVTENLGDEDTTPFYFDGVKRQDMQTISDFEATLSAFTYPDEFMVYEGVKAFANGVMVDGQRASTFGLSYRTFIGEDISGPTADYKIHLLYNLTANPSAIPYGTISDDSDPITFDWDLQGVPEHATNVRPTAHIILDSRYLAADILEALEDILYGKDLEYQVIDGFTPSIPSSDILDGGTAASPGSGSVDGNILVSTAPVDPRLPPLSELIDLVLSMV